MKTKSLVEHIGNMFGAALGIVMAAPVLIVLSLFLVIFAVMEFFSGSKEASRMTQSQKLMGLGISVFSTCHMPFLPVSRHIKLTARW